MTDLGTGGDTFNGNGNAAEQRARQMRLAGALFIFGSLFALPSILILTSVAAATLLPFTALGVGSGIVCLLVPWERISPGWAHVALVGAIAEVAAVAAVVHSTFLIYYVLIGVFVSYAFADRRVVGAYLALITLALVGHGASYAGDDEAAMQLAMLTMPTVLVTAVMIAYLRAQQEASRLKYQRFAEEALALAARLRGEAEEEARRTQAGARAGLPVVPPSPMFDTGDWRRAGLGLAAAALVVPLATASLALAGVRLPDAAKDAFEEVGISLPNQSDGPVAERRAAGDPDGRQGAGNRQARGQGSSAAADRDSEAAPGGSGGQSQSQVETGGVTGSPAPQSPTLPAPPAGGNPPAAGPVERPAPLHDALRDTLDLLDRVVPMRAPQPRPEESPAP